MPEDGLPMPAVLGPMRVRSQHKPVGAAFMPYDTTHHDSLSIFGWTSSSSSDNSMLSHLL